MARKFQNRDQKYWAAFAVAGFSTASVIPVGLGPDIYIMEQKHLPDEWAGRLNTALKTSFENFGQIAPEVGSIYAPKLVLVPLIDDTHESIKSSLIIVDMALATFNRKYISAKAKFLHWNRDNGVAIGGIFDGVDWRPINPLPEEFGPAIVEGLGQDFWDWLFGMALRNKLSGLSLAFYKSLEWARAANESSHVTHKFALNWVSLESLMPHNESQEHAFIRRYATIVGAPRGADSRKIMSVNSMRELFEKHQNPNAKNWVTALKEMRSYRCAILHDGSSDLSSEDINQQKVDWFYHLTKALHIRVTAIAVQALVEEVTSVEDFWNEYVTNFLYSSKNHWLGSDNFHMGNLIKFDWENKRYSDYSFF